MTTLAPVRRAMRVLFWAAAVLVPMAVTRAESPELRLWAGLAVYPGPVVRPLELERLQITFALVNDGDTTMSALDRGALFVNDQPLREWLFISSNGGKGVQCSSLAPGQVCSYSYVLGSYFRKPGTYVVRWEGSTFRNAQVTFRVLADRTSR